MKAKCPQCGNQVDFVEHAKSRDLREIMELIGTFGRDGRIVMEYCELFGPVYIKTSKLLRILWEVGEIYQHGKFSFQKKMYAISQPGMAGAVKTVCSKNFTQPLENHNYLKKVMISIAEEEEKMRSIEAEKKLRQKEARLMQDARARTTNSEQNLAGVRNILKNFGGQHHDRT